jgi:hypothetical protein
MSKLTEVLYFVGYSTVLESGGRRDRRDTQAARICFRRLPLRHSQGRYGGNRPPRRRVGAHVQGLIPFPSAFPWWGRRRQRRAAGQRDPAPVRRAGRCWPCFRHVILTQGFADTATCRQTATAMAHRAPGAYQGMPNALTPFHGLRPGDCQRQIYAAVGARRRPAPEGARCPYGLPQC